MLTTVLARFVAVLRRGDVLPPAVDRRAPDGRELSPRTTLRELTASVPGLRDELVDRARAAGLLVGWVAVVAVPAWTVVDRMTVPELAAAFLAVRLLCDVPMLLAMFALWRLPLGRRYPELLTFAVLAIVQIEIAWMITRTTDAPYHLLGFTLAIYGSGCILVARPRWTVALVGVSALALAGFGLLDDRAMRMRRPRGGHRVHGHGVGHRHAGAPAPLRAEHPRADHPDPPGAGAVADRRPALAARAAQPRGPADRPGQPPSLGRGAGVGLRHGPPGRHLRRGRAARHRPLQDGERPARARGRGRGPPRGGAAADRAGSAATTSSRGWVATSSPS